MREFSLDAVAIPSSPPVPPDDSQRRAAEAPTGPLLVGAGPGTGKTRTLVARVLYLTQTQGVRPENLLLLTFSRKAAREMRERIAAQSPDAARRATIGTFHAYGLELLRRYWKEADLPPSPILLNRAEAFALLEQRIADLPLSTLAYLHDPTFPFRDILGAIGRQKESWYRRTSCAFAPTRSTTANCATNGARSRAFTPFTRNCSANAARWITATSSRAPCAF